jgi:hypothetical protein
MTQLSLPLSPSTNTFAIINFFSDLPTYFLTHPSRGDSLWPAFAGTEAGQGLLYRRRSHPSHPTRDPGLSTALLSRSTLEHAITHSAAYSPTSYSHSFTLKLFSPPLHPALSCASTSHAGTTHVTGPAESASSLLRSSYCTTSSSSTASSCSSVHQGSK